MAAERLSMRQIREILRQKWTLGRSHREVAKTREDCTSGSMRRGEKRVMVHSANGHRTRKGGNSGAPPDLYTTALVFHSTECHHGSQTGPAGAWTGVLAPGRDIGVVMVSV